MTHCFNTSIAKEYGIEEAIIIHYLYFWIAKNASDDSNFKDDLFWTYNTTKTYADFFEYINEKKIIRCLSKLENEGVIKKGNFNTNKWDKTKWYAFTSKGYELLFKNGYELKPFYRLTQNGIIDLTKWVNRFGQNGQINNTNSKAINKEEEKENIKRKEDDALFDECWIAYRRKGLKNKSKEYWNKLSDEEKGKVLPHINAYVQSRDANYQKDFERYLRDKVFNEIIYVGNSAIYDPLTIKDDNSSQNNNGEPPEQSGSLWQS
jgi:DNA-binding PadR family transcriptional regulator